MTFGKALNYAFGQLISFLVKFFRLTSFLCFLSYGYIATIPSWKNQFRNNTDVKNLGHVFLFSPWMSDHSGVGRGCRS